MNLGPKPLPRAGTDRNAESAAWPKPALPSPPRAGSPLFLQLQLGFVLFQKSFDIRGGAQQAVPLLVVERDRETAQAVDADAALFADFKNQVSAAFLDFAFLFQLRQLRFQFFVSWFCHAFFASRKIARRSAATPG